MSPRKKLPKLLHRLIVSFQALFYTLIRLMKEGTSSFLRFLRRRLIGRNYRRHRWLPTAGFVLPTTIMVLLVVGLFAGSLIMRSGDRAEDIIRSRESERIDSIAAPAVERAKAKLEYIFNRDPRFPAGVPSEEVLRDLMLYVDNDNVNFLSDDPEGNKDPYTLPNETRLDLNGDGNDDNAWRYETDLDGDGTQETVAYSILMTTEADTDGDASTVEVDLGSSVTDKAENLVTRTGPLSIDASAGISSDCDIPSLQAKQGWFAANATSVRKNFQVNVFVENQNEVNKTVAALEFQQDRQLDKGNKFGVWFRYDLLIHPGPQFNLNGAVHTDGNLITWNDSLRFYLVSSPASCIYNEDANIIELAEEEEDGNIVYQSQAISTGGSTEEVDLFHPTDPVGEGTVNESFSPTTDSVDGRPNNSTGIYPYTLDPLILFTEDRLVSRGQQNSDGTYDVSVRDTDWRGSALSERIRNAGQSKPYVDDLYRADDRWGPKPKYGKTAEVTIAELVNGFYENGDLIEASDTAEPLDTLIGLNPPDDFPQEVGLDGYWERRAYTQGLRVIVGQRLELGNAFGWQSGGDDPLNPIENVSPGNTFAAGGNDRANEQRQLKTLRDNLAAVQATAVYHYNDDTSDSVGDFPVATLATTAHPGTIETRNNSFTFDRASVDTDGDGSNDVLTNFLEGQGTNGWEFEPPEGTKANFESAINDADSPLRRALTNLAYFAGDPDGAFPPKQDDASSADAVIHPYPQLTMWGDYSNLRRVINQLENGTSYDDLSLADKTTLQTASATLGMLAYNMAVEKAIYDQEIIPLINNAKPEVDFGNAVKKSITKKNKAIYKYITNNDVLNDDRDDNNELASSGSSSDKVRTPQEYVDEVYGTGGTSPTEEQLTEYYSLFTAEQYIKAYNKAPGGGTVDLAVLTAFTEAVTGQTQFYPQIQRDRTMGFEPGLPPASNSGSQWNPITGISNNSDYYLEDDFTGQEIPIVTGCDPDIFDPVVVGSGSGLIEKKVGLALAMCDGSLRETTSPEYPSLYYLFPVAEHDHLGNLSSLANATAPNFQITQPTGEPYINDTYISNANSGKLFGVVQENSSVDGFEDPSTEAGNSFSAIALQPRERDSWELPSNSPSKATGFADAAINEIDNNGTPVYIPFLDKGMYNGRQQMAVRVLNIDLDLLRSNTINGESWLPNSGLVYAFREDAVREDGIARPNAETWANCNTETNLTDTSNDCYMDPAIPRDPPKQADNGVSPKPVDYIADPERRPHGFRLSNGAQLGRAGTTRGLSFITDNPAYFLGDFNLHSREEFITPNDALEDDYGNFYSRDELDSGFAKADADNPDNAANDDWRPTEVLADALTFLSNSHCDGVIEDAIEGDNNGCASGTSSYRNTKLDASGGGNTGGNVWVREDPDDTDSPIALNRNGKLLFDNGSISEYDTLLGTNNVQELNDPTETTVNSVIVQGLSPTRENETYGGLHNFPRFNEDWSRNRNPGTGNNIDLNIDGSLVQLNFSTYDAANLDQQDTFKPATTAAGGNDFPFYTPPNRNWGYDPALQYNPPGPIVERLLSQSGLRSEIYQELDVSDPYIQQLCQALPGSSPTCP